MPLKRGIEAFDQGGTAPDISPQDFALLLADRQAILDIYRAHPAFLTQPYAVERSASGATVEPIQANRLFIEICEAGIGWIAFQHSRCFPEWADVKFVARERVAPPFALRIDPRKDPTYWDDRSAGGYAFIDLSLYVVHLLNLYVPNAPVLKNIYAVNVHTDALGRENESIAVPAIEKVLRRHFAGRPDVDLALRVRDVIRLIKADVPSTATRLNRGLDFEQECMNRLAAAGFDVRATPTSGDFGADVIATKDGLGYAIQCKDSSKPVGVKGVQEAIGARAHYKTDYAVVCAVAGFTDAAIELAASAKVVVCNAEQLARRLDAI